MKQNISIEMKNCFLAFPLFFFLFALLITDSVVSQNVHIIDSLESELKKYGSENKSSTTSFKDTVEAKLLYDISQQYWSSNESKALEYAEQLYLLSEKINYKKGICLSYRCRGYTKSFHSDYQQALYYFLKGLKLAEEMDDKAMVCSFQDYIGLVYNNKENYKKALEYLEKALALADEYNKPLTANIINNIGNSYFGMGDNKRALENYEQSYEIAAMNNEVRQYTVCLSGIGDVYSREKNYTKSLETHLKSLKLAKEVGDKNTLSFCYRQVGSDYFYLDKLDDALNYISEGFDLAKEIKALDHERDCFWEMERIYSAKKDFKQAYEYEVLYDGYKDSINKTGKNEKIVELQLDYDFEKKQAEDKIEQAKKDAEASEDLKKKKYIRYILMGGLGIVFLFSFVVFRQKKKITIEKHRSEELLLNIVPEEIAKELKETGISKPKTYEMVTVMFTDFKNFSNIAEQLTPDQLVAELDYCFTEFDKIIHTYGIEKIKTIGDSYVCAGGLPIKNNTNPEDVVNAAIEIKDFILVRKKEKESKGEIPFEIRIGVNTGPLVAGIFGTKKFSYDIFGNTVNIASRMEHNGVAGEVNISEFTQELVKDKFSFVERGKINLKYKGDVGMYFVRKLTGIVCLVLSLFLFSTINSFAQENKKTDSLLVALKQTNADAASLTIMDKLAFEFIRNNHDFVNGKIYANKGFKLFDKLMKEHSSTKDTLYINKCKNAKANILMNIGVYYHWHADYGEANKNYFEALKLYEETGYKKGLALAHNNIGAIYLSEDNLEEAMKNHLTALKLRTEIKDKQGIANSNDNLQGNYEAALTNLLISVNTNIELNNNRNTGTCYIDIGRIYKDEKNYDKAMQNYLQALTYLDKPNLMYDKTDAYNQIGETYYLKGNLHEAEVWLKNALELSLQINRKDIIKEIYFNLSKVYKKLNDYHNTLRYYKLYVVFKDSVFTGESQDKIAEIKNKIETEKKEEVDRTEQQKKDAAAEAELNRERILLYSFSFGFAIILVFLFIVFYQKKKITIEKKRSEDLLLNILPEEVAAELKEKWKSAARNYESVSVMFSDFENFDTLRAQLSPDKLVMEINYFFCAFDEIINKYEVEKIKTYGEVYMCVGGLPVKNSTHATNVVEAAKEIIEFVKQTNSEKEAKGELPFEIRIGINTGNVVAGIVGVKKFAYDIWGDTVNIAARMEQNSEAGKINVSGATYQLIKNNFACLHRGKIEAKNKGEIDMYFVED